MGSSAISRWNAAATLVTTAFAAKACVRRMARRV
jgi:hypothetical protein